MTEESPAERLARWRSVAVLSRRTRPAVREGRAHPESGRPFKAVTDELGNTVTEHSAPGRAPGVSDRQDVNVRPETVRVRMDPGA
jgi:hypothetical protein